MQRAIENYREYITSVSAYHAAGSDQPLTLTIYPDMDNLFVGNAESIGGLTDIQRRTVMSHWIGAAANLIVGSDLTQLDALGIELLTSRGALGVGVAGFTQMYPMQPRNPGSGGSEARQLQAWIAGPSPATTTTPRDTTPTTPTGSGSGSEAVVLLANYGPDLGNGGFNTNLSGKQKVSITLAELGIAVSGKTWSAVNVWTGQAFAISGGALTAELDEGESLLLKLS